MLQKKSRSGLLIKTGKKKYIQLRSNKTLKKIGLIVTGLVIFIGSLSMTTKITEGEKDIFYTEKEKDEVILPELKDGQFVALEGQITRGNEKENTIGFLYNGHVLTCKPKDGKITKFKNNIISNSAKHLFPEVIISGVVERRAISGDFKEKRPRIIFDSIEAVEIIEKESQIGLDKYIENVEKKNEN
jgi:hypothetical protein